MMPKTNYIIEPGKQEIIVTREFDAPRDLVFKVCLDKKLREEWWGPRELKTKVDKLEAKRGGEWRIVHTDPQGNEYGFHGVFHDVVPPERYVETFEWEGMPGHVSFNTATLEDIGGGKTKLTLRIVFQTVEDRDGMVASGMQRGMDEGYDRMDEILAREQRRKAA